MSNGFACVRQVSLPAIRTLWQALTLGTQILDIAMEHLGACSRLIDLQGLLLTFDIVIWPSQASSTALCSGNCCGSSCQHMPRTTLFQAAFSDGIFLKAVTDAGYLRDKLAPRSIVSCRVPLNCQIAIADLVKLCCNTLYVHMH